MRPLAGGMLPLEQKSEHSAWEVLQKILSWIFGPISGIFNQPEKSEQTAWDFPKKMTLLRELKSMIDLNHHVM